MSTADLTQLLIALTGLIIAVATLVRAFQGVHAKIDSNTERIDALEQENGHTPPPVNR